MPEIPSHRICSKCKVLKPADAFRIDKRFNILESRCRECGNAYSKRYVQTETGRDNARRRAREYARTHREEIKARVEIRKLNPPTGPLPSHKECTNCKEVKPASEFYVDKRWHLLTSHCRQCKENYYKQYKATEHGKQIINQSARDWYRRPENRSKVIARDTIHKAVYRKKLIKPDSCSQCGKTNTRIEAHHFKGYAYENRFDVVWLCSACHKKTEQH